MAVTLIDIGRIANDGTGDDLREAFRKVNSNFEELDLRQPETTTASNRGLVGEGVFAEKVGFDLQFKKLVQGNNVTLNSTDNAITVNAIGGLQNLLISADGGSIMLADGDALTIAGGADVTTSIVGSTLTIDYTGFASLVDDPSPQLGADLEADQNDIINANVIQANNFQGSLDGLVYGIDIRTINSYFGDFDFGELDQNAEGIFEWIIATTDVDFGSITNPNEVGADLGSI